MTSLRSGVKFDYGQKEALKIVQEDGWRLENLPAHFKKDKEIVLEAVKQFGLALQHADKSLKKDKEIVVEAMKEDGVALHLPLIV